MICPYCLNDVEVEVRPDGYFCSQCGSRIYSEYVRSRLPRVFVGMVGFSGHGKTTYITSLVFLLKDVFMNMGRWKDFSFMALDMETLSLIYDRVKALTKEARLPEATPVNFPTPFVMQFFNIPYLGDWFITFYDVGGEVFEHPDRISVQGNLVAKSSSVIFILSLRDCGDTWEARGEEAFRLLNTFILGRDRLYPQGRDYQNLIVTLTKADTLVRDMPKQLAEYLIKGDYREYTDLSPEYGLKLSEVSNAVREWLYSINPMKGFLSLAERSFRKVRYSVVSAIGSPPVGDKLLASLRPEDPKRVLDPFLWTLYDTEEKGALVSLIESFSLFLKRLFSGERS